MGETIRYLMVAVVALISIVGSSEAQGPSGGFEFPKSLSGAVGEAAGSLAEKARSAADSATKSLGVPGFTGGVEQRRAVPRAGGPSTEPTSNRDSDWLTEAAAGRRRPSTAPFSSRNQGILSGTGREPANDLRSGGQRSGGVATVAATQDPQSREAQLMARARSNALAQNNTASQGNAAAQSNALAQERRRSNGTSGSSGFGSLPEGVSLPTRGEPQKNSATFGSEFARGSTAVANAPARPVFGPKTAAEANFDPSIYNRTNSSDATRAQQNLDRGTAQQNLLMSRAGGAGSALGQPAPNTSQATATLPSSWTYQQIAALGEYFGVTRNDPRMSDTAFVNKLYALYREDQADKQARQSANSLLAKTVNATDPWASKTEPAGPTHFGLPKLQAPATTARGGNPSELLLGDQRFASRDGIGSVGNWPSSKTTSNRPDVDPRLSQKDIDGLPPGAWSYDKYGNPIDKERYVLDRFGERVDEETQWELTFGRKRKLEEERLARLQADRERVLRDSATGIRPSVSRDSGAETTVGNSGAPPSQIARK